MTAVAESLIHINDVGSGGPDPSVVAEVYMSHVPQEWSSIAVCHKSTNVDNYILTYLDSGASQTPPLMHFTRTPDRAHVLDWIYMSESV